MQAGYDSRLAWGTELPRSVLFSLAEYDLVKEYHRVPSLLHLQSYGLQAASRYEECHPFQAVLEQTCVLDWIARSLSMPHHLSCVLVPKCLLCFHSEGLWCTTQDSPPGLSCLRVSTWRLLPVVMSLVPGVILSWLACPIYSRAHFI